jgi:hypothetical protein
MIQRTLGFFFTIFIACLLGIIFLPRTSNAVYFYLEGNEPKCFIEELPKETMVVCTYSTEELSDVDGLFRENPNIGIQMTVEELSQQHLVSTQKGSAKGHFTFTSSESGDHSICFSTNSTAWFTSSKTKLHLDVEIGEPTDHAQDHKETLSDLAQSVRELNTKVQEIRREQSFQREREAEFRDLSEMTNSRVVWWTILQLVVLGATCVWQMRHMRGFFVAKKLV